MPAALKWQAGGVPVVSTASICDTYAMKWSLAANKTSRVYICNCKVRH